MNLRRVQVQAFIERVRALEPSIAESVKEWCEMDVVRFYEQRRDMALGIPIVGLVSNIPERKQYKRRAKKPMPVALKKSFYIPAEMFAEIEAEAKRQGRTITSIVHRAWQLARPDIQKLPGVL